MIWVIGGTCETVELVQKIRDKMEYIITAATEAEREFLVDEKLIVCRIDEKEVENFIRDNSIDLVVDLSHPYAFEVTKNAREAAEKFNINYIRYVRQKTKDIEDCIYLDSISQCREFLKHINGCVFFTTGSKNIKDFESVRGNNRFVYRVLPTLESIAECQKKNIKIKDIIAALGPFSEDLNFAMFKEYDADYVVMKDSGKEGGTDEKVQACRRLNIEVVIIGRNNEDGADDIDDVINLIRQNRREYAKGGIFRAGHQNCISSGSSSLW